MALIFYSILYLLTVNFFPWCYQEGKIYQTYNSNINDFQQQISSHSQDTANMKLIKWNYSLQSMWLECEYTSNNFNSSEHEVGGKQMQKSDTNCLGIKLKTCNVGSHYLLLYHHPYTTIHITAL